jgi:hypothetical protein
MAKRKGFPPILCLVFLVFMQSKSCASCSGVPSNFNDVVLNATSLKITAGQMVTITATVPKDTTGAGVSWTSSAPPGIFSVTSVTVATYTAPNTVTAPFTITVTATTLSPTITPPETKTITITVNPPPPLKLKTTTLPNGILGTPYPAGTQLQATGGVPPYQWTLATGTFPPGLALNLDGTITSTPTPTATGVFNTFTVTVTDSETPPLTLTTTAGQLSITVTNLLSGNYAFEFSGFNASGAVVVAGSFTADGVSQITGGVEDFNSIVPNSYKNQTFTGTYTLNGTRGQLIFTSLAGSPTYDFAVDSKGLHGRMVEFDATGIRGSGELVQQNTATCGSQTMSGAGPLGADFVVGLSGAEASFAGTTPGPFAAAGRFSAEVPANSSTPGNIDNGQLDATVPGSVTITPTAFSGTFQTTSQAVRCTMTINATTSLPNQAFSVYPITSTSGLLTEAFIVETDAVSQTTPFVSAGKLIHQTGYPFSNPNQSFTAASVAGLSGPLIPNGGSAYVPFAAVARLQATGSTAFTLSLFENLAGNVASALGAGALSANFNAGDQFGRVDTNLPGSSGQIFPVFYIIGTNEALCMLENANSPVLGIFEPQSNGGAASFSSSTIAGTLAQGTSAPATTALQNFSGFVALVNTTATSGTVAGIQDLSTTGANTAGLAVTGTYALTASGTVDGSGTLSLTQAPPPPAFNGGFFIVSPTKAVMITTTNADASPVLIFLGQQADDFGVN